MTATNFNPQINGLKAPLMEFAFKLTRNSDESLELYEATLKQAEEKQATYTGGNLQSWFFSLMRRLCATTYCRRMKENQQRSLLAELNKGGRAPIDGALDTAVVHDLQGFVNGLDENSKTVFVLHYYGYTYQEIRQLLGTPVEKIQMYIAQARQRLREFDERR